MNSDERMSRAQMAMMTRSRRAMIPRAHAVAGLNLLAFVLVAVTIVALWSLAGFITV